MVLKIPDTRKRKEAGMLQIMVATANCTEEHWQYESGLRRLCELMKASKIKDSKGINECVGSEGYIHPQHYDTIEGNKSPPR